LALNNADMQLIETVTHDLRVRFQHQARFDGVTQEEFEGNQYNVEQNSASRPVAITKDELRENSGRRVARDAYLNEIASAFNQRLGVIARADLDAGVVYAHAVPDARDENAPMGMAQLNADAQRARVQLADEDD